MKQTNTERPADILMGAQGGDEGKGAEADRRAPLYRYVVRANGGANAGNTIWVDGQPVAVHQLPSGIFLPLVTNVIAAGCVVDAPALMKEWQAARKLRPGGTGGLLLSERAQLVMPFHRWADEAIDSGRAVALGTTKSGIGPCYADRCLRLGMPAAKLLLDEAPLTAELQRAFDEGTERFALRIPRRRTVLQKLQKEWSDAARELAPFICDTEETLQGAVHRGWPVLLVGAQGYLLDIAHGTYPFVTSSATQSAGLCHGAGLPPTVVGEVIGVAKAYVTRVGAGPLPTQLSEGSIERLLRERGREYGATTGRPRRIGWLNVPDLRRAVRANGITFLTLTKIDVLAGLKNVRVAVTDARGADRFPTCAPGDYETFPGWAECSGVTSWRSMPKNARHYIESIEERIGVRIGRICTGPRCQDFFDR